MSESLKLKITNLGGVHNDQKYFVGLVDGKPFSEEQVKEIIHRCDCHDDLVAIKKVIQEESDRLDARITEGKHDDAWPNPEYIKDEDWAGMIGERLVYHRTLSLFEAALAKVKKR